MTYACDTSILIPLLSPWHPAHSEATAHIAQISGVPVHALLETYSVLTRLPLPYTTPARDAAAVIASLPWPSLALPQDEHVRLPVRAAQHDIKGGAVYDGLIAATAAHHCLPLMTRDSRAQRTYRAFGLEVALLS